MKTIGFRLYEIEYIEKIEKLLQAGVGTSFSDVCKQACFEGIDLMYARLFDKASQVAMQDKLDEISSKLTEYTRKIYKEERENLLVGYINQQIVSSIHNILLNYLNTGTVDIQGAELGMFDGVPERFVEQLETQNEDII